MVYKWNANDNLLLTFCCLGLQKLVVDVSLKLHQIISNWSGQFKATHSHPYYRVPVIWSCWGCYWRFIKLGNQTQKCRIMGNHMITDFFSLFSFLVLKFKKICLALGLNLFYHRTYHSIVQLFRTKIEKQFSVCALIFHIWKVIMIKMGLRVKNYQGC